MKKITFCSLALLFYVPVLFSQTNLVKDKSKFIYNFTREIEWPAEYKNGNFVIQVYGSDEMFNELKTYTNGKMVVSQPITLKKIENIEEIDKCHVLFVTSEKMREMSSIKRKIGNNKTLVITDKSEGVLDGVAISFAKVNDRLFYEISTENIVKAGLKYSQDLVDMVAGIPVAKR